MFMKPKKQYTTEELAYWREANRRSYRKHKEERTKKVKEYKIQHRDKVCEWNKINYLRHREERIEYAKKYSRKYPKIKNAHNKVFYHAVPLGSECEKCGSTRNLLRHHPDYNEPLKIQNVCRSCHAIIHRD